MILISESHLPLRRQGPWDDTFFLHAEVSDGSRGRFSSMCRKCSFVISRWETRALRRGVAKSDAAARHVLCQVLTMVSVRQISCFATRICQI